MSSFRALISIPLFAAISFATALAKADDERAPAPPLPESNFVALNKLQTWLHKKHDDFFSPENQERIFRKIYKEAGLNQDQIEMAFDYDERFALHEKIKMIKAGISPDEINGYPNFFTTQCVYILHNNGIGAEEAQEILDREPYYVTKETAAYLDREQFEAYALGVPYFYFQDGQELHKSFQQIISDYNENLLKKEFGKENIKRFKKQMYVKTFDQCRYEVYAEVIRNFLDPKRNTDKPLALCSLPSTTADHNHFFSKNPAPLLVNQTRLLITQANENRLADLIVKIGEEQGLDEHGIPKGIPLWVDCGHGARDSIHKGHSKITKDKHELSIDDLDFVQRVAPFVTGDVILHSCGTANGYDDPFLDPNRVFARWLANHLPNAKAVRAAPYSVTDLYKIIIDDNGFRPFWNVDEITFKANDHRAPAPPLPENVRVGYELKKWLEELHYEFLSDEKQERIDREAYADAGLTNAEIRQAFEYDKRFSCFERIKMIQAGIYPSEINGYPEFFRTQTIFDLRNNGISPSDAHDMLCNEPYCITKDTTNQFSREKLRAFSLGVPYTYYQKEEALKPYKQIISEYNENLLEKEFGQENIKRFKEQSYVKTFDQCRYEVYAEVIKNFLDPKYNANKPLALCSLPSSIADENNVFSMNPISLLLKDYKVMITQANENQLANLIVKLGEEQGLDEHGKPLGIPLWVDCGHGSQDSIHKDQEKPINDEDKLSVGDDDFITKISPYITGNVMLYSCETARNYKDADSDPSAVNRVYTLWLRKNLHRARIVYAAVDPISSIYGIKKENCEPVWDADLITLK